MASLTRNRARQYRQRAEEARTKGDAMTDPDRRRELLQIADTWERMAEYEEKHPVLGGLYGPQQRPDSNQRSE